MNSEPKDPQAAGRSITTLASREIYRNPWMRLREDEILRSNGKRGIYGVVDKDDCAIILPIDNDRIWLVEQFRYTIQQRALELLHQPNPVVVDRQDNGEVILIHYPINAALAI